MFLKNIYFSHISSKDLNNKLNQNRKMEELSKSNFQEKVHNNPRTTVVDFYSETCPPCKMLAPVFDSVSEKLKDKADFFKIKLEDNQEIFAEYAIQSVPTVMILKQSAPVSESLGFKDEDALMSWLNENI